MHEYSRIRIEDYCIHNDFAKSRELSRLVELSCDFYAEAPEEDASLLRNVIEKQTDLEMKDALEELEVYLFCGDSVQDYRFMFSRLAEEFPQNVQKKILKLQLELVGGFFYGAREDWDMEPEERQKLLKLAKADHGIFRDIYVSPDMNLHALHYAIQRLFDWQSSHLHNFSLSEENLEQMTVNQFGKYNSLCGGLSHLPNDDYTDLYWDDDPAAQSQ